MNWNSNNRSGKWFLDEERYAGELMVAFHAGLLSDVEEGLSLRKLLAKKLFCSVKRISKKFEGTSYNGKMIYLKKTNATQEELVRKQELLLGLEKKFLDSITYCNSARGLGQISPAPAPHDAVGAKFSVESLLQLQQSPSHHLRDLATVRDPTLAEVISSAAMFQPLHSVSSISPLFSLRQSLARKGQTYRAVLGATATNRASAGLQQPIPRGAALLRSRLVG